MHPSHPFFRLSCRSRESGGGRCLQEATEEVGDGGGLGAAGGGDAAEDGSDAGEGDDAADEAGDGLDEVADVEELGDGAEEAGEDGGELADLGGDQLCKGGLVFTSMCRDCDVVWTYQEGRPARRCRE